MNRLTNGKNRNRTRNTKSREKYNVNKIARNKNSSKKRKYNSRKPSLGLKLRKNAVVLMLILCAIVILFMNRNDISAFFTSLKTVSNSFSIDAYYDVTFHSNNGQDESEVQTISYNVPTELMDNPFDYDGYEFNGWNTEPDGSGTSYVNKEEVNNLDDIELYAQWELAEYCTVTFNYGDDSFIGTNYINSGIGLFNTENIGRDFEVSTTLSNYQYLPGQDTDRNVFICNQYEGDDPYQGFAFQYRNGSIKVQANCVSTGQVIKPWGKTSGFIKFTRTDNKIYYDDTNYMLDYTNIPSSFTAPLSFGANIDENGNPRRFCKADLADMSIKLKYLYTEIPNLTLPVPTRTNYIFDGWYTEKTGGTKITVPTVELIANKTIYAHWIDESQQPVTTQMKYAVQIYGINEDVDKNDNKLGLTFGPATGDNYNNKYVTHRYEETAVGSGVYNVIIVTHTVAADGTETTTEEILKNSSENNVIRTSAEKDRYDKNIHSMTWSQIAAVQNKEDFLDCMLCGDTKAVEIVLNSELDKGNSYTQNGDGAGFLEDSIKNKYIWWNPTSEAEPTATNSDEQTGTNGTDAGGYSSSHMRATLIGFNDKTDVTYAGSTNLTASNSLYSCINEELKSVITSKKVKYVTGGYKDGEYILNDDIADKIWLFSSREIGSIATYGGKGVEGLGDDGHSYGKFSNTDSHFYLEPNFSGKTTKRGCYREDDKNNYYWWLRTPYLISSYNVSDVGGSGSISYGWSGHGNGIAFGFCIDKAPINYTVKFDPNGGTGEMADQPMKSNTKVALRENAFTYEERAFIGWNTKADGSGTSYADKEEVSNLASTEGAIVTLYAQWRRTGDPKKGDYVAYHPVASEIDSSYTDFQSGVLGYTASDHTYHISNNYLGLSSIDSFEYNNEFTQEDLRWRIWDIDSEKVRLVPETSTQQKLGIKNTVGFNNGLFLMNDICSKLYAGEVDGITAKSLTYKDIEEKAILKYASSHSNASGYVNNAGKPIWSLENIRNIFGLDSTYGQDFLLDRTNSTTRRFIPTILANESFNKTTTDATSTIYLPLIDMENDYANGTTYNPPTATSYWQGPDSATPGTGRPIMLKQTYYTVSDSPDAYLDSIDKSLVFTGNNYWVASKSLKYTNASTPYFQFYVRLVSDRNTLTQYVLSSTNNQTGVTGSTLGTDGYGLRLRPIVTIDRSKFNFVDGGTEWNITSH